MIVTDVLSPRLPRLRRSSTWLLLMAVLTLAGLPIYQAYLGSSGSTDSSSGAFGPKLQLTVDRREWASGETVRGILAISAPDGAVLHGPAVISVYPAGLPQTASNRVASVQVATPGQLGSSDTIVVPFEITVPGLRVGSYGVNAEIDARVEKGDLHVAVKAVAAAEFQIR